MRTVTLAAVTLPLLLGATTAYAHDAPEAGRPDEYQVVAALYGLDPSLLRAIASVESSGNAFSVSPKGAAGLMQLMPRTAREFQVRDRFDPIDDLLGAARFLVWLRQWAREHGDFGVHLPEVLAAYNAGPQAVLRYKGIPPYEETRRYVRRVLLVYLVRGPGDLAQMSCSGAEGLRPIVCQRGCDRHWLSQLEQIRTRRSRAAAR